jgi:hypothetical protein
MAKSTQDKIEFHTDGWERFERAAEVVGKSPPQHRKPKKTKPIKKIRAKKGKS